MNSVKPLLPCISETRLHVLLIDDKGDNCGTDNQSFVVEQEKTTQVIGSFTVGMLTVITSTASGTCWIAALLCWSLFHCDSSFTRGVFFYLKLSYTDSTGWNLKGEMNIRFLPWKELSKCPLTETRSLTMRWWWCQLGWQETWESSWGRGGCLG